MAEGTILTESGLKKLEEELDYLVSVRRNEISEQIAVARGFGDLSENAEYDEAKKEQAKVEEQITRLQATIRTATVVADDDITTEKVSIGTVVKVKDLDDGETYEYSIVGANEADPMENKISNESPVGAGLIGMKKNQTATIMIPGHAPLQDPVHQEELTPPNDTEKEDYRYGRLSRNAAHPAAD